MAEYQRPESRDISSDHLVPRLLSFSIFLEDGPRTSKGMPLYRSYLRYSFLRIENQLLRFGRYAPVSLSGRRCPTVRLYPRNILNGRICARSTVKIYTILDNVVSQSPPYITRRGPVIAHKLTLSCRLPCSLPNFGYYSPLFFLSLFLLRCFSSYRGIFEREVTRISLEELFIIPSES